MTRRSAAASFSTRCAGSMTNVICHYPHCIDIYIMKINKAWHEKNKMPKNPTFEQRVKWHLAHQKHCSCRPIAGKLAEEMKKKGIKF